MIDFRDSLTPRDSDCLPLAPLADWVAAIFWLRCAVACVLGIALVWSLS